MQKQWNRSLFQNKKYCTILQYKIIYIYIIHSRFIALLEKISHTTTIKHANMWHMYIVCCMKKYMIDKGRKHVSLSLFTHWWKKWIWKLIQGNWTLKGQGQSVSYLIQILVTLFSCLSSFHWQGCGTLRESRFSKPSNTKNPLYSDKSNTMNNTFE